MKHGCDFIIGLTESTINVFKSFIVVVIRTYQISTVVLPYYDRMDLLENQECSQHALSFISGLLLSPFDQVIYHCGVGQSRRVTEVFDITLGNLP